MPAQLFITAGVVAVAFIAWITLMRAVTGGDPVDLAGIFGRPWEPAWPRGVQEEEPLRWRVELIDRRPAAPTPLPRRASPAPEPEERAA